MQYVEFKCCKKKCVAAVIVSWTCVIMFDMSILHLKGWLDRKR